MFVHTVHSHAARLLMASLLGAALCGGLAACSAVSGVQGHGPRAPATDFVYGPYKHLNMVIDPLAPAATTAVTGTLSRLAATPAAQLLPGATAVTLGFASGECGQERWKAKDARVVTNPGAALSDLPVAAVDLDARQVADANVAPFERAGIAYIISTGGDGNVFTCHGDAGMEAFIARYDSRTLVGFDFDIEAGQTPEEIRGLVQRIRVAQLRRPHLRFSFTLPTFAASDGSLASLNPLGQQVLAAIRDAGLEHYFINLMVMDFGPASSGSCVVRAGRCDMAASARQAAHNLHTRHGLPLSRIEVTAMIGVNDVVENVFTLEDATALARFARQDGLGGLHFWSLDRDVPCPGGSTAVAPTCSSLNVHGALAFSRAFAQGLR